MNKAGGLRKIGSTNILITSDNFSIIASKAATPCSPKKRRKSGPLRQKFVPVNSWTMRAFHIRHGRPTRLFLYQGWPICLLIRLTLNSLRTCDQILQKCNLKK